VSEHRILIVNLTRFGDLLQTSPAVAALRERHPATHLTLLADKNFADVCESIPGIDRVYRVDLDHLGHLLVDGGERLCEAYRYVEEVIAELRAARFDLALNFSSSRMTAVFMGLLGARETRGWSVSTDGMRVIRHPWACLFATMCLNRQMACFNLVDCYRAMAGGLGATRRLLYEVSPPAREFADRSLEQGGLRTGERLVALQLGASKAIRQWPKESFAALGRLLVEAGHRVVLIGGGGDRPLAAEVAARLGERAIDLCGKTRIPELAAVLARADALVTGDTGPMHMAAAVGTPIVGLFFGPALPFDTGPYGEDHVLLHAAVGCAPCNHNVSCLAPFCRTEITPEMAAAAVIHRIGGDWGALDAVARASGEVRIYRSRFDRHGYFACEPLGGRPLAREDHLRRAYRATFLSVLEGMDVPRPAASPIETGPFRALSAMARSGADLAQQLALAARPRVPSVERLKQLAAEIEALDRTILEHGATHDDTGVLTQMFRFGKENLESEDVALLATQIGSLYRELEIEADLMGAQLSGAREKERVDDARLHQ